MVEFPSGFVDRADETADDRFYAMDRFVTHIDDDAIDAVGELYRQLELTGDVLARRLRRGRPGTAPRRLFRRHLLESLLPDQSDPGMARHRRTGSLSPRGRVLRFTEGFTEPIVEHRNPGAHGDPLYAVRAQRVRSQSG